MKPANRQIFSQGAIALAVSLMFQPQSLRANPTGAQVVNGAVNITQPNAATLNVTNSPGAIINWQGFSIGAGEVTRFIQQSSSSAVLNRVVGADISSLQGQLLSNGRVFLINPAGIIIGPNAMLDTAGFVGSTLNMQNADFLAGKLRFSGDASSGAIINQGWIRTAYGGNVLLVAPRIENSGLIQTPGGELILAAGQKVTVSSLEQEGVQFEVQAPTDSVVNIGKLLADGGAVGVFAGTIRHSGDIRANALIRDEAGSIVLKATNDIQIAAGSTTSASGKVGGTISFESGTGLTRVAGQVLATGAQGKGGGISILGDRVTAADGALIDASGAAGGGQILLGGDFQGANAAVRNASTTFVGANATLRADATQSGDGGRVIVWADGNTQFYGSLSAQGGPLGGNGGFAEVSGKQNLIFDGTANLGAPNGTLGNLLLDPLDLYVFNGGGIDSISGGTKTSTLIDEAADFPSSAVTVAPATLAGIAGNVTLFASRYMRIGNDITLTKAGQSLTATVGKYVAPALPDPIALDTSTPNRLDIGANITTANGAVTMNAPLIQSVATSKIVTAGGAISLTSGASLSTGSLSLDAGAGAVTLGVGTATFDSINIAGVTGGGVSATAPGSLLIGATTTGAGPLALTSNNSFVNTGVLTSSGGAVTLNAPASSINTGNITGGGAVVTLAANSGVSTGTIDTTGTVALTTTGGSIFSAINNSSGVTASATTTNSFSNASVNITSTTALNASSITATAVNCASSFSCPGASISLTSTGDINVGTLTANAPATANNASVFNNSISRSVSVSSTGGSIFAASPASLITATDVTLTTKQGSGGGIGTAATALRIDTERLLSLSPNGDFNVAAVGTGPTQLNAQLGVAATGKTYTGTLSRSAGGLTLNASATDTTVTVGNLTATGFTQRLYSSDPSITLRTPNGALVATTVSIPEGDTRPNDPPLTVPAYSTAQLPVNISASGALTVTSYTRQSTAASLPKSSAFSSDTGTVTLGTIAASKDPLSVSASAATGSSIGITDLSTANSVSVSSSGGDITVGRIDTSSGTGNVSLIASSSTGTVKAQTDTGALEVTSGGTISVSGKTIGASGFANPLDMAGSTIALSSTGAVGGAIGFAGAPVVANTQSLTLNASATTATPTTTGASFNVNTGATALNNLIVTASAQAVGVAGPATVTTESGKGVYTFASDGANFTFNAGTVSANQFVGGALNFTSNSGDITLGAANVGAKGGLSVTARNGSILGGAALDAGGAISLSAGQSAGGAAVAVNIGNVGTVNRPSSLSINAGNNNFSTSRAGTATIGNIEADGVAIGTFSGNIVIGNIGATTRAGSVNLAANQSVSGYGTVQTGNITAASVTISDELNNITTGNLDATSSITATSEKVVTLGTVNTSALTITCTFFLCPQAQVTTNAITGVKTMSIVASETTINGSVTGDVAGTGLLFIGGSAYGNGKGAVNITGGSITAGDGSNIQINAQHATNPFVFSTINAGATGTVGIISPSGIQQNGGTGVTGATVVLGATNTAAQIKQNGGDGRLDLNGAANLTVNAGGPVALDANGSTLSSLTIQKTQTPGAAAFDLANLGGGQTVTLAGGADLALTVSSVTSPLNFSLNYSAGKAALAGAGITTGGGNVGLTVSGALDATVGGITSSGGSVTVNAGGFNATGGGITTGGATGGGSVNITSNGPLTTGVISTAPTGTGTGGPITINANSGGVVVNGNLNTGTAGGAIALSSFNAPITSSGGAQIISDNAVSVTSTIANIGASGTPLQITTPNATLSATGTASGGNVYAALTNTSTLALSGDSGFDVSSNTAFSNLSVATRGTGAGTMTLAAPGQTYGFARPTTDLFGGAMTNTFQVVSAAGASPVASATFRAMDGDLFVGGPGTSITVPNLTLAAQASSITTGDVKLQGTAANPLALNGTTQTIGSSTRDILVRGAVSLTGTTQNLTANRSITVQAEQGAIAIDGADQSINSTGVSGGTILFKGGIAANESVAVTASKSQIIQSPDSASSAGIRIEGGDGAGSSATVVYTGTGEQTIQSGGNLSVKGGTGSNAIAEIRTATGTQLIRSRSNLDVTGGTGVGAAARIVNTGPGNQQVGESRRSSFFVFPYQTGNVTVQAGAGGGAIAEIMAAGPQQIYASGGTLGLLGNGTNAFARIETTSTAEQTIGCPTVFGGCQAAIGTLNLLGGAGAGSYARITTPGFQRVTTGSAINLIGSTTDAAATMTGVGQDIRTGTMTLAAGAGNNANALVQSTAAQNISGGVALTGGGSAGATATAQITATGNQSISGGNVTLMGGGGTNSLAQIAATGASQSVNYSTMNLTGGHGTGSQAQITSAGTQNVSGGNMTLTGGGDVEFPAANVSATIQGNSQTIFAGTLAVNGGNGTAAGATSDAILRNLSGNQVVSASSVTLTGGGQFSTAGILNQGTGTQAVSGNSGITVTSIAGAAATSSALIQNTPATKQTLTSGSGGLRVINQGQGAVSATTGGDQTVTSAFVEVVTNASGNAILSATGNQWILTTNGTASPTGIINGTHSQIGSMRVAALSTGRANIESGASQLIELDYPSQMQFARDGRLTIGDTLAGGLSRIGAVDQTVFAKSIQVQTGGPDPGTRSELKSSGTQMISLLNGNLDVLGGSGNNSLAQIDPSIQTILVNGSTNIIGGSGTNAVAQILAGTQTLWTTNGNINVTGGSAAGSSASIIAGGMQSLNSLNPPPVLTPNIGGAFIISGPAPIAELPSSPSGPVLALQDTQNAVIAGAEPDELDENEEYRIRRVPQCF